SREAATAVPRLAAAASRLDAHVGRIPTAHAVGYMLVSLRRRRIRKQRAFLRLRTIRFGFTLGHPWLSW
ncbi:MAG: hypothetical protein HYV60_23985, partial [Planctomycetia bacterium]|nr:hypothetical protein [Planctomycetia bacterium]